MDAGQRHTRVEVASDSRTVKRRLDDFLWRDRGEANVRLRQVLTDEFFRFERVAIIGGMVRDFARAGRRGFHSDVDLVIDSDERKVARFARRHNAKANKYGGYSCEMGGWKIDFWALGTTWASRSGHVSVDRLEDVAQCTFFDCDAILYDIKARKIICADAYFDKLKSGKIEINLEPNPNETGSLYRAVRRMILWDCEPGPKLSRFIRSQLAQKGFDQLLREEERKGGDGLVRSLIGPERLLDCLRRPEFRRSVARWHHATPDLAGVH